MYAHSSEGASEWFAGSFDGIRWWSTQVPADGAHWRVIGWRALDPDGPATRVDCGGAKIPDGGPRLFRVDPATGHGPFHAGGA
ncbi:hypothetical protein H1235_15460 [Pseudoxanthomonas sp. NC8]|nr:hypothetical protein H1235_15460 [Pseudoxanthomonas sp. NC8]